MLTIQERVAKGIAYLDEFGPEDWFSRIDLSQLDIADPKWCVLGQVFACDADEYNTTGYWAHQDTFDENTNDGCPKCHGFDFGYDYCDEVDEHHYASGEGLRDEWITQLKEHAL
jgi:hypothetical protein